MKNIIIAHQTVTDGDAIGHDILGMYDVLKSLNYNVYIYGENCFGRSNSLRIKSSNIKQFSDNDLLIYHHSIYWENGEKLLSDFKGKVVFKYHNITPPEYYRDFSDIHHLKCHQGIEQTKKLINSYNNCFWWGDSEFNSLELRSYGLNPNRCLIVPPFNVLDKLDEVDPNFEVIDELISSCDNNVLFVGRVAPNKGHEHLIKIIKTYNDIYNSKIHLWIIGAQDDSCKLYTNYIFNLVNVYDLQKKITLTGKVPVDVLKAYYIACDGFICMSEHEGFCVPLIEAQKLMLPVITYGGSALSETVGNNQIILDDFDYEFAAAALYTVFSDEEVTYFCKNHGIRNYTSRFTSDVIKNKFISALNMLKGSENI